MPRKKKSESQEISVDGVAAPEAANESASTELFVPGADQEFIEGEVVHDAPGSHAHDGADGRESNGETRQFRPVRHTFTSKTAGVHAGEDKRFNAPQAFVDFDDDKRATDAEKAELRESGFRYRPSDKGYSALANSETRQARDDLSQKFTERRLKEKAGQGEGNER